MARVTLHPMHITPHPSKWLIMVATNMAFFHLACLTSAILEVRLAMEHAASTMERPPSGSKELPQVPTLSPVGLQHPNLTP